jgi:DNA-binding transcriptional ArsR family regulator
MQRDLNGCVAIFRRCHCPLAADAFGDSGEVMVSLELVHNAETAAEFLSAIGNGKRFAILCHLLLGEMSVGELAEKVDLSQSALSQHLAKLRAMGLVNTRRDRQMIYYSTTCEEVRGVLKTLDRYFGSKEAA